MVVGAPQQREGSVSAISEYFYCFACKRFFKSRNPVCQRCGKGTAPARRELLRSTPRVDIYQIFVGNSLVGNQRVEKHSG